MQQLQLPPPLPPLTVLGAGLQSLDILPHPPLPQQPAESGPTDLFQQPLSFLPHAPRAGLQSVDILPEPTLLHPSPEKTVVNQLF